MIDVSLVEDEIRAIETEEETTIDACERLACLYVVRDHLKAKEPGEQSEFLAASVGIPLQDLMRVLDGHMNALRIVYPAEYADLMKRINALHEPSQSAKI